MHKNLVIQERPKITLPTNYVTGTEYSPQQQWSSYLELMWNIHLGHNKQQIKIKLYSIYSD
jgi:hypothetical protein